MGSGEDDDARARRVLELSMGDNYANAKTIREYLGALLKAVWSEREGFSGKRPFGDSGWAWDLYTPLVGAGFVSGRLEDPDFAEDVDRSAADELITQAIDVMVEGGA